MVVKTVLLLYTAIIAPVQICLWNYDDDACNKLVLSFTQTHTNTHTNTHTYTHTHTHFYEKRQGVAPLLYICGTCAGE